MPKLRDRKALKILPDQPVQEEVVGADGSSVAWSAQENQALLSAVKKHGTFSVEPLVAAVKTRNKEQVLNRLRRQRRAGLQQLASGALVDCWLERLVRAWPSLMANECGDQAAAAVPLHLAAAEERRQAARHGRADLGDVYTYLAYLASGAIPPQPSADTSRKLLALLHHLAALMKSISLSRHCRWLWCSKRIRRLASENFSAKSEPPQEPPDLALVPEELWPTVSQLLEPDTNPLQAPAALLLSPLATQLDEAAAAAPLSLLAEPDRLWRHLANLDDDDGQSEDKGSSDITAAAPSTCRPAVPAEPPLVVPAVQLPGVPTQSPAGAAAEEPASAAAAATAAATAATAATAAVRRQPALPGRPQVQVNAGAIPRASVGIPPQGRLGEEPQVSVGVLPQVMGGAGPQASVGVLPQVRLGTGPQASVGGLPHARVGAVPQVRVGVLSQASVGVLPQARIEVVSQSSVGAMPQVRLGAVPLVSRGTVSQPSIGTLPKPSAEAKGQDRVGALPVIKVKALHQLRVMSKPLGTGGGRPQVVSSVHPRVSVGQTGDSLARHHPTVRAWLPPSGSAEPGPAATAEPRPSTSLQPSTWTLPSTSIQSQPSATARPTKSAGRRRPLDASAGPGAGKAPPSSDVVMVKECPELVGLLRFNFGAGGPVRTYSRKRRGRC